MEKHFTITCQDVQNLQNTIDKVQIQVTNGNYETYEYFLTDNDEPLDFLSKYYDLWTYEEFEDNNIDYYFDLIDYCVAEIDFEEIFIETIDNKKKLLYIKNIDLYKKELKEFIDKCKNELELGNCENDIFNKKYDEITNKVAHDMQKEYLYGSYGEPGILKELSNRLAKEGFYFEFDKKNWDITLSLTDDYEQINNIDEEDFEKMDIEIIKQQFLDRCKLVIIQNLKIEKEKKEKQKEENLRKLEETKKQQENEKNKIIEKIQKSIAS